MFLPLHDRNPIKHIKFPYVTYGLIALNLLCFLLQSVQSENGFNATAASLGVIPIELLGTIPGNGVPEWWTLITYQFLHGDWLHVLSNMLFLWIFGDNVEDRMGHGRFIVFYLLCGTVAAIAHVMSEPGSPLPTIGASGAVAGVMGAYFVLYPRSRILALLPLFIFWQIIEVPAVLFLGLWFVLQLFSGVGTMLMATEGAPAGGIAFWAHVAGFLAGVILVYAFRRPERARVEWWDDSGPRSYRA